MTTIVWDGFTLATDSKVSINNSLNYFDKKVMQNKDVIVAMAGDFAQAHAIAQWVINDYDPDMKPDLYIEMRSVCLVICKHTYKAYIVDEYLQPLPAKGVVTLGSGSDWALAALDFGCDAVEAVKYAITRDNGSGGKVNRWRIRK